MRATALVSPGVLAGAGAAFAGMAWAVRGRSSTVFGPSVWRGPAGCSPGHPSIALTFDDGPSPATVHILELLRSYQALATFFQCGANVRRAPELSAAVRAAGHEIGNHSETHPNFALRGSSFIHDEFRRAQEAILEASGETPVLMR